MKYCYKCKSDKPFSEFSKNRKKLDGFKDECKECSYAWNKARHEVNLTFVRRYKKIYGCQYCGYKGFSSALTLDHIDPLTKGQKGKSAVNYQWSRKRLKEEIRKCRILCSNCHNALTNGELKL